MPYNIGLKTKTFGESISILDSEHIRYIRGALTIDKDRVGAGFNVTRNGKTCKILAPGVPLAKNATSGKYVPVRSTTVKSGGGADKTTCVLTDPKPFMVEDEITIGGDEVTIDTIDYETGAITWTGAVTIADGDAVLGTDGEGVAKCLLAEEVDVTEFDQVATGFDHARVIEARLPVTISAQIKSDLKDVAFV